MPSPDSLELKQDSTAFLLTMDHPLGPHPTGQNPGKSTN